MSDWQDRLMGYRMRVDQTFADRVAGSALTSRQWNLAMTAVEFQFRNVDDPEYASLAADTSALHNVISDLRSIEEDGHHSGGLDDIFDRIKQSLGFGEDEEDLAREIDELASAYAGELEAVLREEGVFEDLRRSAAGEE